MSRQRSEGVQEARRQSSSRTITTMIMTMELVQIMLMVLLRGPKIVC
jgi:hypothetical protein